MIYVILGIPVNKILIYTSISHLNLIIKIYEDRPFESSHNIALYSSLSLIQR